MSNSTIQTAQKGAGRMWASGEETGTKTDARKKYPWTTKPSKISNRKEERAR